MQDKNVVETFRIEEYNAKRNGRAMVRAVSDRTHHTLQVHYVTDGGEWTHFGALRYVRKNGTVEDAKNRLRNEIGRGGDAYKEVR